MITQEEYKQLLNQEKPSFDQFKLVRSKSEDDLPFFIQESDAAQIRQSFTNLKLANFTIPEASKEEPPKKLRGQSQDVRVRKRKV